MHVEKLGTLTCRVFENSDIAASHPIDRVVVLMHGFGAPGDDLAGLAPYLKAPIGTRLVFPEAPIDMGGGRAWWLIDWQERARFERSGDWEGYASLVPPGLAEANHAVNLMLSAIENQWGVPNEHLVLGGFSQGAMLALDVAAQRSRRPGKLVMLSGSIMGRPRWQPHLDVFKNTSVFQSHGRTDAVLPFAIAEKLHHLMQEAGANVTWVPFAGGHAIPEPVLTGLQRFIA